MLVHRFETKTPASNRTSSCWAPLRDQDTGNKPHILVLGHHFEDTSNKSYISVLGHHFETKTPKQIIHLNAGASLRDQDTDIKSYILVLGHHFETKTPATDQDTGNKSYIFVLGHHFETKTPATKRTSQCWGTTSRPRHRQQIIHLSAGAALDHDIGNKSYILVLGHHFETKTPTSDQDTGNKSYIFVLGHDFETKPPATNRTF